MKEKELEDSKEELMLKEKEYQEKEKNAQDYQTQTKKTTKR